MKFLKSFRSNKNLKKDKEREKERVYKDLPLTPPFSPAATDYMSKLPPKILKQIFRNVCPHSTDESYDNCEDSAKDGACMLCDQRDLAKCMLVARSWRGPATSVLFNSLRIDTVHYCELEGKLAEKRRRKTWYNSNHEGEDPAIVRLRLLADALQSDPSRIGSIVQFLKLPYMIRETCKADLARAIGACPNLLYVDLPDGVFVDDVSCLALRAEVQGRCPNLRKMAYLRGAERSLAELAEGCTWPNLEVLELTGIHLDPSTLRRVLAALPYLHKLKVSNMKAFTNDIFQENHMLPPFPALKELHLDEAHNITAEGIAAYISQTDNFSRLETLTLTATGVLPSSVYLILSEARSLRHLSIVESITESMPADPKMRSLSSSSLQTLHWELTSGISSRSFGSEDLILAPYYDYLRNSLLSQNLPNLEELYVRDPGFPETLVDLAPPKPIFAYESPSPNKPTNPFIPSHRQTLSSQSHNFGSRNPFNTPPASPPPTTLGISRPLTIYTKGLEEMEWNYSEVQPTPISKAGNRSSVISVSAARPISSYGLLGDELGLSGRDARKSVMVGNGFGGYLAVPESEVRPSSSYGEKGKHKEKRSTRIDMWR